jgi:glucose-1-phosphate adenylyltransferase
MGNYLFDNDILVSELRRDAADPSSEHDFGKNMLPDMIHEHPLYAYDFHRNVVPGEMPENRGYWRDVGTIEAYFEASMDLRSVKPALNLYNYKWPLRTAEYPQGPSKFTFDEEGRRGHAVNSVVSEGCILAGSEVRDSILGRRVFADNGAVIENSIVMDGCHIGAGARIRKAIIDKNAKIEPGTIIGFDEEEDRARYQVSSTGIVVVEGYRSSIPVSPAAI